VSGPTIVALWAAAFVGTHFLLSHPLRAPLVRRLGRRGFSAAYSAVAFATFIPMVLARRNAGPEPWLWDVGQIGWLIAAVLMWTGSVLFVGSLVRNPAVQTMAAHDAVIGEPVGVFRITRHPMMWGFALWAIVHLLVQPEPSAVVIAVAVLILALFGAAAQDRKKQAQLRERWTEWLGGTSFIPFGRGLAFPGWVALVGGTALFLLATWLHPLPVGVWQWVD
jgi:uncharacterized membrane protein